MGFAGRAFSGLWVAGIVLGAAILAAVFAGYWFFITEQRQYIVGRDFRLLSTLARQIDGTVESETRVITNLADDAAVKGQATTALAERWVKLRGRPYQAADIQFEKRAVDKMTTGYAFRTDGQLTLEVPLRPRGSAPEGHVARLKLQPGLESMFRSRVSQGAFDAILLGTQDGKVLLSAGATAQQIRSSGLGVLSSKPVDGGKAMTFPELAKSITMAEVSLAGVDYALFVFPCCLSSGKDSPLVLTGLVHAETLRSGSWAIPTTLVKVAVLGLLIAMVAWPFLKLILLGDRQQVRVSDFFQLGAASVAGLAIITILLLDSTAYLRLNRDMDAQLKDLADDLDAHATAEIRDAYAQLVCLERKTKSREVTEFDDGKLSSVLQDERLICDPWSPPASAVFRQAGADTRLSSDPELRWPYPFMDTVAFSDRVGMQQVKLGASRSVSNRIPVGEREYFSSVVNGRGWRKADFCKDEKCALESIWSWTTGEARAVVAKESSLQWGAGKNLKFLPVAAISIPMRSLIGPVLPPGFTFAVIDHSGKVLFHSDSQRNGNEDLFVETDNNRRLRAQIAAHSAEPLNIRYWGSEYRAYLKPMSLPDMYVVAMAQKERTWAINREWLVVTLIFVTIYLVLWLIVALATLGRNASWVWPDAARQNGYVSVSGFCAVLLIVALMTAWYLRSQLSPRHGHLAASQWLDWRLLVPPASAEEGQRRQARAARCLFCRRRAPAAGHGRCSGGAALSRVVPAARAQLHQEQPAHRRQTAVRTVRSRERRVSEHRRREAEAEEAGGDAGGSSVRPRPLHHLSLQHLDQDDASHAARFRPRSDDAQRGRNAGAVNDGPR